MSSETITELQFTDFYQKHHFQLWTIGYSNIHEVILAINNKRIYKNTKAARMQYRLIDLLAGNLYWNKLMRRRLLFHRYTNNIIFNATIAKMAYYYATYNIKGVWPLGEKAIASDPQYAYWYAKYIIYGSWPPGEKAIASNPQYACLYARDIIEEPWPPGEKAIASNPSSAYWYAEDIIKSPFPEGEKAIASIPFWKKRYESLFKVKL